MMLCLKKTENNYMFLTHVVMIFLAEKFAFFIYNLWEIVVNYY